MVQSSHRFASRRFVETPCVQIMYAGCWDSTPDPVHEGIWGREPPAGFGRSPKCRRRPCPPPSGYATDHGRKFPSVDPPWTFMSPLWAFLSYRGSTVEENFLMTPKPYQSDSRLPIQIFSLFLPRSVFLCPNLTGQSQPVFLEYPCKKQFTDTLLQN